MSKPGSPNSRLAFLDGLRGIAAMAVVVYHFQAPLGEMAAGWVPEILQSIFSLGYLGVDVFFVISGFVIPLSIRNIEANFRFLGRFALKRSLRLDPAYWAIIVSELLLIKLALSMFPGQLKQPFPDVHTIVAHFFYAQDLLGYGNIISIFWTLCIEVQFYLFFVLSLICYSALRKHVSSQWATSLAWAAQVFLFLLSLVVFYIREIQVIDGIFLPRWFQFYLGYLAMRSFTARRLTAEFLVAVIVTCAFSAAFGKAIDNGNVAVITASLLLIAGLSNNMSNWLNGSTVQFLGRISYSLYLVHLVVGWRFLRLIQVKQQHIDSNLLAIVVFIIGVLISVFSAWVLFRIIERPSHNWSKRIPLKNGARN